MNRVVTIGETMVSLTNNSGPLHRSQILHKRMGGAESNVAIGLTRLGHEVQWISKVGKDPFGDEILYHLRGEGVHVDYVKRDPDHSTGLMIKDMNVKGDPNIYYYRKESAASHLTWEDIDLEVFDKAEILHITGITLALSDSCRELIFKLVNYAKSKNIVVSFDPNLRLKLWSIEEAKTCIEKLLPLVDFFIPGKEEMALLTNTSTDEDGMKKACEILHSKGVPAIICKLGESGCLVSQSNVWDKIPGTKVKEVDSVGAGDGFCAGFLSGLLENLSIKDAAERGSIVGAITVTGEGDYDAIPTREQLDSFLGGKKEVAR